MPITLREFVTSLGFVVNLEGLNAYEKSLQRLDEKAEQMYGGADKLIKRMEDMGKSLSMKLTLPITALGAVAVEARVKQEEIQTRWGVMLGSLQQGIEFQKQLRELSERTIYKTDQIDEYAMALKGLRVPVDQIIPRIKMFTDIAAGTGQDSGALMQEWAEARLNPIMRGRMLRRLMISGTIDEKTMRANGIDPRLLAQEGRTEMIGQGVFDNIFRQLYRKNAGKGEAAANNLGKNLERFWTGLTKIRESIGKMIEVGGHLNKILSLAGKLFGAVADLIDKIPKGLGFMVVGFAALFAALGPGMVLISQFAKMFFGAQKVMMLFTLNPLTLEILGFVAALAAAIFLWNQFMVQIKKNKIAEKKETAFFKGGGNVNQFRNPRGIASDATSYTPDFYNKVRVGAPYGKSNMSGLLGQGNININVNNPSVNLPPGSTEQQKQALAAAHEDIIKKTLTKATLQIHNAIR